MPNRAGVSLRGSLRLRLLAFVFALVLLSLLGSALSLYRITEVSRSLDAINKISVPLGKLISQMKSDGDILVREMDRRLGYSHWNDSHWKPQPLPAWLRDILESQFNRAHDLIESRSEWASPEVQEQWRAWISEVTVGFEGLKRLSGDLYLAVRDRNAEKAMQIYPQWGNQLEDWNRKLSWGAGEFERHLRGAFSQSESRVKSLRVGLQAILIAVVFLSLLLIWIGEKLLRPLAELTRLARAIGQRGLRKEDKTDLPEISLSRRDEVSQLAREFHAMATTLLERDKTVELQKRRIEEQNRLAAIGRMSAQVAHEVRNPLHSIGLEAEVALERAVNLKDIGLKQSLQSILESVDRVEQITENYLKLSRLSSGRKSPVDLGEVLESTLAVYAQVCEQQGVRIDWRREPGASLMILGDKELLQQVLGNLLRNSLQALEAGAVKEPRILFELGNTERGGVWLKIRDNGPGIDPEIRSKLFVPFVTTRAQGTGLGLSFARKVMEEHEGDITCPENPKDPGATFLLVFKGLESGDYPQEVRHEGADIIGRR